MRIGTNNWKLTICRGDNGVTILRAATCDEQAALPEELFGLPVTALGDHALVPDAKLVEGEEMEILGAPGAGAWDNRALRELTLPPRLHAVGDYALMNCRNLRRLCLCGGEIAWGTGALMNCRELGELSLESADSGTLAYFAGELNRELDVSLREDGICVARLIFPEYVESYEENGPAHHFDYKVYGVGQPYRHVFRGRRLNFYDYDALWRNALAGEWEEDTALRLAWWRLYYPKELSTEASVGYRGYLTAHAAPALRFLLSLRDTRMLSTFLSDVECDALALRETSALARENGDTAALALLMDELHRRRDGERSFEL